MANSAPAAVPSTWTPQATRSGRLRKRPDAFLVDAPKDVLEFADAEIRRAAREFGPGGPVPILWARRMARELWLRRLRHIPFRTRNGEACAAYRRMRVDEFTGINLLQAWANWRTIPRNLNRVLPARPVLALDLCCAIGQSTAVLAYYCPSASRILGLESSEEFVSLARRATFTTRSGEPADVTFNAQNVLETFRASDGHVVASESVDLVNCIGAIGCHFTPQATTRLVAEVRRVLITGGIAILDSGREGTNAKTLCDIAEAAGFALVHKARSCIADPRWQLCFRKMRDADMPAPSRPSNPSLGAG